MLKKNDSSNKLNAVVKDTAFKSGRVNFENNMPVAVLLLLIYPLLIFPDVFFGSYSLDPASLYEYGKTFDTELSPYHVELASSVFYERPLNLVFGDMLRNFQVPNFLFNTSLGMPTFEQLSTKLFYPLQVVENMFQFYDATAFTVVRIYLASVFLFVGFLHLGICPLAATIVSSAISSSSVFVWFLGLQQMQNVIVAMAMCFYLTSKFQLNSLSGIITNSAGVALLILSGQPEVALFCIPVIFLIAHANQNKNSNLATANNLFRNCWRFAISCTGALIITFPAIEPFATALLSQDVTTALHGLDGAAGIASPTPPTLANVLLFPNLSNYLSNLRTYPFNGHLDSIGFYIGLPILVLMLSYFFFSERLPKNQKMFLLLGVFSGVLLLKNYGVEPFFRIGELPIVNLVWSPRWSNVALITSFLIMTVFSLNNFIVQKPRLKNQKLLFYLVASLLIFISTYQALLTIPIPGQTFIHGQHYSGMDITAPYFMPYIFLPSFVVLVLAVTITRIICSKHQNTVMLIFPCVFLFYFNSVIRNYPLEVVYILSALQTVSAIMLLCLSFITTKHHINLKTSIAIVAAAPISLLLLINLFYDEGHQTRQHHRFDPKLSEVISGIKDLDHFRVGLSPAIMQGNEPSLLKVNSLSGVFSLPPTSTNQLLNEISFHLAENDKTPWYPSLYVYGREGPHSPSMSVATKMKENALDLMGVKYTIDMVEQHEPNCTIYEAPYCLKIRKNAEEIVQVFVNDSKSINISNKFETTLEARNLLKINGCWTPKNHLLLKYSYLPRLHAATENGESLNTYPNALGLLSLDIAESFCGNIYFQYKNPYTDKIYFPYIILLSLAWLSIFFLSIRDISNPSTLRKTDALH